MRLEIGFRGKKYSFSNLALIIFPLGLIVAIPFLLQINETIELVWLQELFAKNVVFFLNLFFNLGAYVIYKPIYSCPWLITYTDGVTVYIDNGCIGFLAMSIFVALIIFTPHTKISKTRENILWRKSIAIIIMLSLIYLYNIFRVTIQFYLYSRGFAWSVIHDSSGILAITISFHIAFFLIFSIYVPEWFLSIFYAGKLIFTWMLKFLKK
jgi:exosortase/archaeosortase family protein